MILSQAVFTIVFGALCYNIKTKSCVLIVLTLNDHHGSMVTLINLHNVNDIGAWLAHPDHVYIGRETGKVKGKELVKWGNPFRIGVNTTRKQAVHKYESYIQTKSELIRCIGELQGKTLGCWCCPRLCHGVVLQKLVGNLSVMSDLPKTNHFKAAVKSLMDTTKTMSQGQGKNKPPAWFMEWSKHLTTFLTETSETIQSLEEENIAMDSRIKVQATVSDRLVDQVHELRQYSRRTNLLIHGVEEEGNGGRGEDTDAKVTEILHTKLGLQETFVPKDISRSHRLGKPKNGKKRPIIVRFTSYNTKKMVFDEKKKLKGSGVSITENLSPERYDLYQKCMTKFEKENVWTLDGRIFCLTQDVDEGGRRKRIVVTKEADLADLAD